MRAVIDHILFNTHVINGKYEEKEQIDPTLSKIKASVKNDTLFTGVESQISVIAKFSDGREKDVTNSNDIIFRTNDADKFTVSKAGLVKNARNKPIKTKTVIEVIYGGKQSNIYFFCKFDNKKDKSKNQSSKKVK
ncbi:hypothetical protein [Brevibacillus daliensis]|uniref:hypothetical protein n=1 Tax=Brevibacillus daliensis TaxID=2892995 RepID=UPI001E57F2E1|nr:hypothetical protein [Brevibacillus daliensis]